MLSVWGTKSRKLIDMLPSLHVRDSYSKVVKLEKRIEQGLLQQCKELGEDGSQLEYILPGFVKVKVKTSYSLDNLDHIPATPFGEDPGNFTILAIQQRDSPHIISLPSFYHPQQTPSNA